jgi:hypothetical protein
MQKHHVTIQGCKPVEANLSKPALLNGTPNCMTKNSVFWSDALQSL